SPGFVSRRRGSSTQGPEPTTAWVRVPTLSPNFSQNGRQDTDPEWDHQDNSKQGRKESPLRPLPHSIKHPALIEGLPSSKI
ncbi:hypothetical protein DBR06_SOUSAS110199, partial [Sousa chinensis]